MTPLSFKATSDSLILNNSNLTEYPIKTKDKITLYPLNEVISNNRLSAEEYIPSVENSIVVGEGDVEGYFSEIPVLPKLTDDELKNSFYFPLSDSLKGTPLEHYKLDGVYGTIHDAEGKLVGNYTPTSPSCKVSDPRLYNNGISTKGSYHCGCAVSSNVKNLALYPEESSSWESCIGCNDPNKTFDDTYKHLNNNPYQAEDSFELGKKSSNYQTVLHIPVTIEEPGIYCASLYLKTSKSTKDVYGPFLCKSPSFNSVSVNITGSDGTKDLSEISSFNRKNTVSRDWSRYHCSYSITSIEGLSNTHISLIIPFSEIYSFAGILLEKVADTTSSNYDPEDVTDIYKPSAYSSETVCYSLEKAPLKYPLLLELKDFPEVLKTKNWIISYKRRFDTTSEAADYHYDKIGHSLLVGYHGSKLYINTDSTSLERDIKAIDGNSLTTDDFYNNWEQVILYPEKESDNVVIEVVSLKDCSKNYRVTTSELRSDTADIAIYKDENPLNINVMLGGKIQTAVRSTEAPTIDFTSGYYRDFIYLYNVVDVENTLAEIKNNFFGLNKHEFEEGTKLLMFSNNIFEKGDNI